MKNLFFKKFFLFFSIFLSLFLLILILFDILLVVYKGIPFWKLLFFLILLIFLNILFMKGKFIMKKNSTYDLSYLKQPYVYLVCEDVHSQKTNQDYQFLKLCIKTDAINLSVNIQNYTEFEKAYLKNIVSENDYVIYKKRKQYVERGSGRVIDYDLICISRAEPNVIYLEEFPLKLDSTSKQVACSLLDYINQ